MPPIVAVGVSSVHPNISNKDPRTEVMSSDLPLIGIMSATDPQLNNVASVSALGNKLDAVGGPVGTEFMKPPGVKPAVNVPVWANCWNIAMDTNALR